MALAAWQATIVDGAGNAQGGATVEVRDEATGALALLKSDRDGLSGMTNPATADANGFIRFYVQGGAYRITAVNGEFSREWRHVGIGTASEFDRSELLAVEPDQSITSSGTVTVAPGDRVILINKSVLSDTPFILPTLASRNYVSLMVVDYSGLGGTMTFTPDGSEKINTLSSFSAISGGAGFPFVVRLHPFTGVGWCAE